jgi:hypothetical protein
VLVPWTAVTRRRATVNVTAGEPLRCLCRAPDEADANGKGVSVLYLPPYSPDLSPIELWIYLT